MRIIIDPFQSRIISATSAKFEHRNKNTFISTSLLRQRDLCDFESHSTISCFFFASRTPTGQSKFRIDTDVLDANRIVKLCGPFTETVSDNEVDIKNILFAFSILFDSMFANIVLCDYSLDNSISGGQSSMYSIRIGITFVLNNTTIVTGSTTTLKIQQ